MRRNASAMFKVNAPALISNKPTPSHAFSYLIQLQHESASSYSSTPNSTVTAQCPVSAFRVPTSCVFDLNSGLEEAGLRYIAALRTPSKWHLSRVAVCTLLDHWQSFFRFWWSGEFLRIKQPIGELTTRNIKQIVSNARQPQCKWK